MQSQSVKRCWHQGMKPAGIQAAGCTVLGPSVLFAVLSSDLPFGGPRLLGDSERTYSERSLTMVAEWGQ